MDVGPLARVRATKRKPSKKKTAVKCSECRFVNCQTKKTLDGLILKGSSIRASDICKQFQPASL